jgi:hypothetical protein
MTLGIPARAFIIFTVTSALAQGLAISLFAVASRTEWALEGKIVALALTLTSAVVLLTIVLRPAKSIAASFMAAVCLAIGYLIAFFSLGALVFPGLLSESRLITLSYVWSVLGVFGVAFLLYLPCALAVFCVLKYWKQRSRQHA